MEAMDDMALLREYATRNSEAAFGELAARRVGFVYSAALRQVRDPALAEEITQAVFVILARKAGKLSDKTVLTGWLFRTTRFTALAHERAELKRKRHEQEIQMQSAIEEGTLDPLWEQLSPLLDEALAALHEKDRQAILLRFFEGKSLAEVGNQLATSEDTARKRVARALEKLRKYFAKRGVVSTTAIIAGAVSANSVQAAPATLAKAVTVTALAKGAAASTSTLTLIKGALKIMAWTKAKTAVVLGGAAILATGTATIVVKEVVSTRREALYEAIFAHPDSRSMPALEGAPPTLVLRPTKYSGGGGQGIGTPTGKEAYVNESLKELFAWAYGISPSRVILPDDAPTNGFDYLNSLPSDQNGALRERLKNQFGLVAHRQLRPTDVLLLQAADPMRLSSFRTRGGRFACYGTGVGNTQYRYCTNCPMSLLAGQVIEGYWEEPCIDQTDPNARYDFAFHWETVTNLSRDAVRELLRPVIEQRLVDLGLRLVPAREPVEMLVVKHAK